MSPDRAQDYPVLAPFRRGERTYTAGLIRLPAAEAGPLIEAGLIGEAPTDATAADAVPVGPAAAAEPVAPPTVDPAPAAPPRRRRRTA